MNPVNPISYLSLSCCFDSCTYSKWPWNVINSNKGAVELLITPTRRSAAKKKKEVVSSFIFIFARRQTFTSVTLFTTLMRRLFALQSVVTSTSPALWTPFVSLLHGDKIRTPQSAGSTSGQEQPSKPIVTTDSRYPARKKGRRDGGRGGGCCII